MENLIKSFNALTIAEPGPRGRGRAAALIDTLNRINKANIKLAATYSGTEGSSINLVSSSAVITLNKVYLYEASFNQEIQISQCLMFLKRMFTELEVPFAYNGECVIVPKKLAKDPTEYSLTNRKLQCVTTLTLRYKECITFNQEVLNIILSEIVVEKNATLYTYSGFLHQTNMGTILNIAQELCTVSEANFSAVVDKYFLIHGKNYQAAVEHFLGSSLIYNKQDKHVLKLESIDWCNRLLKFKLRGCGMLAAFQDCHIFRKATQNKYCNDTMTDICNVHKDISNKWNLRIGDLTSVNGRVLTRQIILFGDNNSFIPHDGSWNQALYKNDFYSPVTVNSWIIFYLPDHLGIAKILYTNIEELQDSTGMTIGTPLFILIENNTKNAYIKALCSIRSTDVDFIIIIIPKTEDGTNPVPLIQHICCVKNPIACLTVKAHDIVKTEKMYEIIAKMNVIVGGSLWSVVIPIVKIMFCGIDVQFTKGKNICSFVTSLHDADVTQWYSKVHYFSEFKQCFMVQLQDVLLKYQHLNGFLPTFVVIYQNYSKCFNEYVNDLKDIKVCIVFVKMEKVSLRTRNSVGKFDNAPPGTVVDHTITACNTRGFYLSSDGVQLTYYEIIKDTCNFNPDEIQMLTYKLCHMYYKYTKIAKMPAPLLYARKLCKFVIKTILDIPSLQLDTCLFYLQ